MLKSTFLKVILAGLILGLLLAFSCKKKDTASSEVDPALPSTPPPAIPATLIDTIIQNKALDIQSGQIVVAYAAQAGANTGVLLGFEQIDGGWKQTFNSQAVNFGKSGFAPPGEKKEGDKKTPTGIFGLGPAFGYQKNIECAIDFVELTDNHYWISDSESEDYNKLVTYVPETKEIEKMRRKDDLYRYGLVVQYNMEPVKKYKGSAIFIHNWRALGKPTLGCISMPESDMIQLIKWLEPGKAPVIVMGNYDQLLDKTVFPLQ